jgi:hypothetical protein
MLCVFLSNDLFDLIMCSNPFHHYSSPDKVLSEVLVNLIYNINYNASFYLYEL